MEKRKGFWGEPVVTGITLPNCFAVGLRGLGGLSVAWNVPRRVRKGGCEGARFLVGVLKAAGSRDLAKEDLKVKEDVSVGFDHSKSMGDSAERACIRMSVWFQTRRGKQPSFSLLSTVDSKSAATQYCEQPA